MNDNELLADILSMTPEKIEMVIQMDGGLPKKVVFGVYEFACDRILSASGMSQSEPELAEFYYWYGIHELTKQRLGLS